MVINNSSILRKVSIIALSLVFIFFIFACSNKNLPLDSPPITITESDFEFDSDPIELGDNNTEYTIEENLDYAYKTNTGDRKGIRWVVYEQTTLLFFDKLISQNVHDFDFVLKFTHMNNNPDEYINFRKPALSYSNPIIDSPDGTEDNFYQKLGKSTYSLNNFTTNSVNLVTRSIVKIIEKQPETDNWYPFGWEIRFGKPMKISVVVTTHTTT
ncbi:MAG: hypothetical protein LBU60_02095 [Clostridiales bacterium]|jgi:hypothetical protein|nr:hypothetical protein [Clostridiales bacterium]